MTTTTGARAAGEALAGLSGVATPALVLDLGVVERNISRMAARARSFGVALRPHVKTHKSVDVGRLQLTAGAGGITASTLPEVEAFAAAGFDDITWAFPLEPGKLADARRLAEKITLRVLVDDLTMARMLAGSGLHVWLKVDCGYHRAGVDPSGDYGLEVAGELASERGLTFDGILSHSGMAYAGPDRRGSSAAGASEVAVMTAFADRLRTAGIPVRGVTIGSTPATSTVESLHGVTEVRPGNYVFHDRTMVELGVCRPEDVGVTVLAAVVSHQPGSDRFIVDAGALALSKDHGPTHLAATRSYGSVVGEPDLVIDRVTQEHGIIDGPSAAALDGRFLVGDRIRIVPNHSCLTVACHDAYVVVRDGALVDRWPIDRRR